MRRSRSVLIFGALITLITVGTVLSFMIYVATFRKPYSSQNPPQTDIVRPTTTTPDDEGTGNTLVDHRSHSKPGTYYEAVDIRDRGSVEVALSGERSHTHYVDEGPPVVVGKLVSYLWFDNATHEILGATVDTNVSFPVGTHTIGLTVADNTRDTHTAYTTVVIKSSEFNGTYTYLYAGANINNDINVGSRPEATVQTESIAFDSIIDFPESHRNKKFTARVVFSANLSPDVPIEIEHDGPLRFLVKGVRIQGTSKNGGTVSRFVYNGEKGKLNCQLIFTNPRPGKARLVAKTGLGSLLYDYAKVIPVIRSIDPDSSTFVGGGRVAIRGTGLKTDVEVFFGSVKAEIEPSDDDNQLSVIVPKRKKTGPNVDIDLEVRNKNGKSNPALFSYNDASGQIPIKFKPYRVDFSRFPGQWLDRLTGIKYGPDHKFYATSLKSKVIQFELDEQFKLVGEPCESDSLGEHRRLMGLAFNYAKTRPRLYVSSSILYWKSRNILTGEDAWANGKIHVMEAGGSCSCVCELTDISPIISGLPVSTYDHGINGLVFDDDGALHIQVGGFTNAGKITPGNELGGVDENPLSAASLIARVEDPGFNGAIKYRPITPGSARKISGDVEVNMAGLRNSFGIAVHSNGRLYATDNGPSMSFGPKSIDCKNSVDFKASDERYNVDKLLLIRKGRYAGHPNRNRGRRNANECKFYNVIAKANPKALYNPPLTQLPSSTNGIVEYVANSFRGALKGALVLSMYTSEKSGSTMYVKLSETGTSVEGGKPLTLIEGKSGLAVELTPHGGLIFVQVYKREIIAFLPEDFQTRRPVFTSVMPNRGPTKGRNWVKVTGKNFGNNPTAVFGTKKCLATAKATKTMFMCRVPPGTTKGETVSIHVETAEGGLTRKTETSKGVDYKYVG